MKRVLVGCVVLGLLTAAGLVAQQPRPQDVELQAAIRTEVVDGNLPRAIEQYKAIVSKYSNTDRVVAAKALLQMAEAQQKAGDAQAQQTYARIVRDFGDTPVAVTARARIGATGVAADRQRAASDAAGRFAYRLVWGVDAPAIIYPGCLSLDGRHLAYGDYGSGDLYVRDLVTGTNRRMTTTGKLGPEGQHTEGASAFSRDGRQVAYEWFTPGDGPGEVLAELRVINVEGSQQHRVLVRNAEISSITPYGWTPDGQSIVVNVRRKDRTFQLARVSMRDGGVQVLKSSNWRDGANVFVSPDGRFVAFDQRAANSSARDILVLAVDGSSETPVVTDPADDWLVGWSPDGRQVLFASDRTGSPSLWSQPVRQDGRAATPQLLRRDIARFSHSLGVTESGSLFTYTSPSGTGAALTEINEAVLDLAAGRVVLPPVAAVSDAVGSNFTPLWSPDGKYLSWVSRRDNDVAPAAVEPYLAIRSVAENVVRQFKVPLTLIPTNVRWTPDSRSVMAIGSDAEGRDGIYRIDRETGVVTVVIANGPSGSGHFRLMSVEESWSEDGNAMRFVRNSPNGVTGGTLVERDLASGAERQLYDYSGLGTVLSPDARFSYESRVVPGGRQASYQTNGGRLVAFSVSVARERVIVARTIASGAEREIVRGIMVDVGRLSPDGRHLVIASLEPAQQSWSFGVVAVTDGSYRELLRTENPRPGVLAWSPDSRSLIVQRALTLQGAGPREHWWVPLDGREPRRLPELAAERISTLQVHPDGRRIVFTTEGAQRGLPEVHVFENFLPTQPDNR